MLRSMAPACPGTNGTYGFLTNSRSTKELENLFLPSRLLKSILLPGPRYAAQCIAPHHQWHGLLARSQATRSSRVSVLSIIYSDFEKNGVILGSKRRAMR